MIRLTGPLRRAVAGAFRRPSPADRFFRAAIANRDFQPIEASGLSRPRPELARIDLSFAKAGSALRPDRFTI